LKQIRKRLTYANVMSSIAVFFVLSGATAFAATKIGSNEIQGNSITTGKIKKEAVSRAKIKKAAVDASKLADGAVTNTKIADNAVTSNKIADGAVTGNKIADGAVTGNKLAAGTIGRGSLGAVSKLIPQGFAYADFNGEVDPAFTENIPNATNPSSGIYCFDLAFAPRHAQATVQADGDSNDLASVDLAGIDGAVGGGCPAGTDLLVEIEDTGSATSTSEEFFVVVW